MKKNLLKTFILTKWMLAFGLFCISFTAGSQALIREGFDYNLGDLAGQGDWKQLKGSADTPNPIQVVNFPMEFTGYAGSPYQKAIEMGDNGQDVTRSFSRQSGTTLYYALLVNFKQVQASFTQGGSTLLQLYGDWENAGVFSVKQSPDGQKMVFGIGARSSPVMNTYQWTTEEYELNKTHLIVVKYTFATAEERCKAELFVNPVLAEEEPLPTLVSSPKEIGTQPTYLESVEIYQGNSKFTPLGWITGFRLATTWQDAVLQRGTGPEVITDPENPYNIGDLYTGENTKRVVNVKANNLKGDITVSVSTPSELEVSPTTITKAQAESFEGFELQITPLLVNEGVRSVDILFDSEDMAQQKLTVTWNKQNATTVTDLADLQAKLASGNEGEIYTLTGEAVVSYVYTDETTITNIYIQDDKAGMLVWDGMEALANSYKAGDKITGLIGMGGLMEGRYMLMPSKDMQMISENNAITPLIVPLSEIQENPDDYYARLIQLEVVEFTNRGNENGGKFAFGTNNKITQNGETGNLFVFSGADYIGENIPAKAHLTVLPYKTDGTLFAPRAKADIVEFFDPVITPDPATPVDFGEVGINVSERKEVRITAQNLSGDITAGLMNEGEGMFTISPATFPKDAAEKILTITFKPTKVGEFNERVALNTKYGQTVYITVSGKGNIVWEGDKFPLDDSNPLALLEEGFGDTDTDNVLSLAGWKNISVKGFRAWRGGVNRTEKVAKATIKDLVIEDTNDYEMRLYTPALDSENAASKIFTFRVMGQDLGNGGKLQLYCVTNPETVDGTEIGLELPQLASENGVWREYHVDLTKINTQLPEKFFMMFRFTDTANSTTKATYYIDDVSYGKANLPVISTSIESLNFSVERTLTYTSDVITVTGTNLENVISISPVGDLQEDYTFSTKVLPAVGGTFSFTFTTEVAGNTYISGIKLSSRGAADVIIPVQIEVYGMSIEDTNASDANIYYKDGNLCVKSEEEMALNIYTVSGVLAGHVVIPAGTSELPYPLAKGIYVIEHKVANNKGFSKILVP